MKALLGLALLAATTFVVPAAAENGPFTLQLDGTRLTVYAGGKLIITWNDYKGHEVQGDYIVLVDSADILGAYGADGRIIVHNYTKAKRYWAGARALAILDKEGVFDAYRVSDGFRFVENWRDTVTVDVRHETIALLDSKGVFDAYTTDGGVIVRNYRDAREFTIRPDYVAIVDAARLFDAYRRDGTDLVRNWRDTKKFLARRHSIAIVDTAGVLQAYRVSDGFQVLRQNGVTDIQSAPGGVHYLQNGQWRFFAIE